MTGFDNERCRYDESRRHIRDVHADFSLKAIDAIHGDSKALTAAAWHGGIRAIERDFEIRLRIPDDQTVSEPVATEAARVADTDEVFPIGCRREVKFRIR